MPAVVACGVCSCVCTIFAPVWSVDLCHASTLPWVFVCCGAGAAPPATSRSHCALCAVMCVFVLLSAISLVLSAAVGSAFGVCFTAVCAVLATRRVPCELRPATRGNRHRHASCAGAWPGGWFPSKILTSKQRILGVLRLPFIGFAWGVYYVICILYMARAPLAGRRRAVVGSWMERTKL